jgi:hypothetical protein
MRHPAPLDIQEINVQNLNISKVRDMPEIILNIFCNKG